MFDQLLPEVVVNIATGHPRGNQASFSDDVPHNGKILQRSQDLVQVD